MRRARLAIWLALFALALVALAPRAAFAQDRRIEVAAKEAMRRARADFSAADYDGGLARLLKATRACGTIRCSAPTRAALLRDTGVMQVRRGNGGKAAQLFVEALQVDKRVEIPPVYDVPDVRGAWNAALEESNSEATPQPTGDFTHTPAPEQAVSTPLPIYVEYGGSDQVASVIAKYRAVDATDWKRVNLVRSGRGFGGMIPCADVKLGVMRYYIQGFDSGGSPNALSGDPKHPFHVAIRKALVGSPPSLPGQPPPATCAAGEATAAVPPAEKPPEEGPAQCIDDSQCNGGVCTNGRCAEPEHREESRTNYAHVWVGVSLSVDVVVLPGASDVCKLTPTALPENSAGYYCTNPDGSDYPSRASTTENNALAAGNAGQAPSSLVFGDIRVLASFDYAFTSNLLVGARFGAVLNGYSGTVAAKNGRAFGEPIHAELRGTYVFGKNALAHSGFSPMLFVGGGIAQYDASENIIVTQTGIPGWLPKTAWLTSGPGFVGVGGGVRYQFSQRVAFNAALKLDAAFGANGVLPSFGPEIALQYGF
ncbi:MAG: hypothetical protein ACLQVI_28760 [Polyangiaceae bacterium]